MSRNIKKTLAKVVVSEAGAKKQIRPTGTKIASRSTVNKIIPITMMTR